MSGRPLEASLVVPSEAVTLLFGVCWITAYQQRECQLQRLSVSSPKHPGHLPIQSQQTLDLSDPDSSAR